MMMIIKFFVYFFINKDLCGVIRNHVYNETGVISSRVSQSEENETGINFRQ